MNYKELLSAMENNLKVICDINIGTVVMVGLEKSQIRYTIYGGLIVEIIVKNEDIHLKFWVSECIDSGYKRLSDCYWKTANDWDTSLVELN